MFGLSSSIFSFFLDFFLRKLIPFDAGGPEMNALDRLVPPPLYAREMQG